MSINQRGPLLPHVMWLVYLGKCMNRSGCTVLGNNHRCCVQNWVWECSRLASLCTGGDLSLCRIWCSSPLSAHLSAGMLTHTYTHTHTHTYPHTDRTFPRSKQCRRHSECMRVAAPDPAALSSHDIARHGRRRGADERSRAIRSFGQNSQKS